MKALQFIGLFFLVALVSALLHEFGHCLLYWAQGIPAGMSMVKEYPLRNITDSEYAVGSLGGPLSNLVQLSIGLVWVTRAKAKTGLQRVGLAFVLANVCYFLVRSGIALLSGDGGELTDAAGLIGLTYQGAIVLFLLISAGALLWTARAARLRFSFGLVPLGVSLDVAKEAVGNAIDQAGALPEVGWVEGCS
jgi:hypothetical protein